jgi:hypothetical protein
VVKDLKQVGVGAAPAAERGVVWAVGEVGEVVVEVARLVSVCARRVGREPGTCPALRATRLPAAPAERTW